MLCVNLLDIIFIKTYGIAQEGCEGTLVKYYVLQNFASRTYLLLVLPLLEDVP